MHITHALLSDAKRVYNTETPLRRTIYQGAEGDKVLGMLVVEPSYFGGSLTGVKFTFTPNDYPQLEGTEFFEIPRYPSDDYLFWMRAGQWRYIWLQRIATELAKQGSNHAAQHQAEL